eukprot:CAMPEP_0117571660 /NCGR_PEP_ID=MMETSP0784-20121206/59880_1 /TAXON_ID=39447 /ORGANISM="" /LENGTH=109 /DNA_ID=CAMNT_0005369855 /DNA_START=209 /DNA_END=535 /DNA_ORIENTATION=+
MGLGRLRSRRRLEPREMCQVAEPVASCPAAVGSASAAALRRPTPTPVPVPLGAGATETTAWEMCQVEVMQLHVSGVTDGRRACGVVSRRRWLRFRGCVATAHTDSCASA